MYYKHLNHFSSNEDNIICVHNHELYEKYGNVFAPFDYEGTTTSYELKSRRNKYNDYSTTYLPGDKVKPNHPKKQTFLFHFTDGTYYIHYDKELFETFDNNPFRRYREGVRDVKKPYLNIPIEKLVKI